MCCHFIIAHLSCIQLQFTWSRLSERSLSRFSKIVFLRMSQSSRTIAAISSSAAGPHGPGPKGKIKLLSAAFSLSGTSSTDDKRAQQSIDLEL